MMLYSVSALVSCVNIVSGLPTLDTSLLPIEIHFIGEFLQPTVDVFRCHGLSVYPV